MNPYDLHGGHLTYIINKRIQDYKEDIEELIDSGSILDKDKERIRQDQVIIQELEKILTGRNLWVLSSI